MQRALAEARATGRLGTGIRNRDQFLAQLEGVIVDDDPAQGMIDGPIFTHPDLRIQFSVPPGYLMSNGTDRGDHHGLGGQGAIQRRALSRARSRTTSSGCSRSLTGGQSQLADPAAAAHHDQRHAGGVHHGAGEHIVGRRSTSASSPISGTPTAVYHFVMLTPGGTGDWRRSRR